MRIAICHENVLPKRGGAEMYVADLTRRLCAAGHDVHLYGAQWDAAVLPKAISFHQLPTAHGPRSLRPWKFSESLRAALVNEPGVSLGFDKVLGTDVYYPLGGLHVASAVHNLLKHRPGLPRLLARFVQKLDPAQRSFAKLEKQLLTGPNAPLFVANSDLVRRHAKTYYDRDPAGIAVVHNAIDPQRFSEDDRPRVREEMRRHCDLTPRDVVAGVVAMNYRLKGLSPLLHALTLVPKRIPFRLLIAGSPKIKPWQQLASRLGVADRVRFIGHCPDVRRVFFASDFFVHPTFYDPCSLVVLEALACGLPVITTKNNGAGERMHPPADGFVIDDPHDLTALAARITDLLDADRRAACAAAARRTAGDWTFDDHVRAFEKLLGGISKNRSRAAS